MALAAKAHVADIGPKGLLTHESSDGTETQKRCARHGANEEYNGENMAFGDDTALDALLSLFIDDGVPDRGHRTNIFCPNYDVCGVFNGPHKEYQTMTCVDYGGGDQRPKPAI